MNNLDTLFAGATVGLIIAGLLLGALILVLGIVFLASMSGVLKKVKPENRKISPASVWLMLIPFFNWVWVFFMVNGISKSLQKEFADKGKPGTYSSGLGWAFAVTHAAVLIPALNFLALPTFFVIAIIYWSKIASYGKQLTSS